ncbi:ROK family protein [Alkalibacillus almallahensis]|uniref:ROK family protein n=1 Tax=Alkalibacillus almallahensis TaxID=1379154 RepID=UPI00141D7F09|nr:ROK family protein [Alkalibacillus almallahensis]NIK11460.1 glucokinase [Alkalibacillus almallahensis]
MKVLGVDIGGTKIRFGIIDEQFNVHLDTKVPTSFPLYETLEREILTLLHNHPEIERIGIGTHGFVDSKRGRVVYATDLLPGWSNTEVKSQLEAATNRPVAVDNDANVAALAEATLGAAKSSERSVCLTLGTGLGGGVILDNCVVSGGPHGGAAEIGHMILYPHGHPCPCGRKGCAEQYVSGTALKRRIDEAGLPYTPETFFENIQHDEQAEALVKAYTSDLAVVISSLQAIFDMDTVVIGGGVSESASLWFDYLHEHLDQHLLNPIEVKTAQYENDAGMLGAASLVLDL